MDNRSESRQLRRHLIVPDRERTEAIQAFAVARLGTGEASRRTLRGDGDARNRCALLVDHAAGDVTSRLLRKGAGAREQEQERCSEQMPFHPEPPQKRTPTYSGHWFDPHIVRIRMVELTAF